MKNFILTTFILLGICLNAQTYTWAMAEVNNKSDGIDIAYDNNGNVFVSETYSSHEHIAINKYDANHNFLWKQTILVRKKRMDGGRITTDNNGNVYVIINSWDTIRVSGVDYPNPGEGAGASYLIKYNANGILQNVKPISKYDGGLYDVIADNSGNIYLSGGCTNAWFDTMHVTGLVQFVAKYSSAGNMLWFKKITGGAKGGITIKQDNQNDLFISSCFYNWAKFDNIQINAGDVIHPDVYLAKLDTNGNWLWVTKMGGSDGSGSDYAGGLAIDPEGNAYVSGLMGSQTAQFGTVTVTNTGDEDWFLAKYTPSGNCLWAKCGGGPGSQGAGSICADNNSVYMARTGTFFSKFDDNGNYLWSHFKPGVTNAAMVSDGQGAIYFTGSINDTIAFGNHNLIPIYEYQMYIAKLYDPAPATSIKENKAENLMEVYPNPTNQFITISFNNPVSNCCLKIINSIGQTVYTENIKETGEMNKEINVNQLAKGLYVIELTNTSHNSRKAQKLIIE